MMVKIRYTCAAVPPQGISVSAVYDCGKDKEGFYIQKSSGSKQYIDVDLLKMLFTPVDTDWKKALNESDNKISK